MALDWEILKKIYIDYFKSQSTNKNQTMEETSKFIESQYLIFINNGSENFQNKPLSISVGLADSLLSAMKISKKIRTGKPNMLNNNGIKGVIQIWVGATMSPLIPPPPATIPMSNNVNNPGVIQPMNIINSVNECSFAEELIRVLKLHASTISGINIGMTSPPSNTVIPAIWTGIN